MAGLRVTFEQEQAGLGEVVGVQEFAERRARAPELQGRVAAELGLVHLADQGRQDMGVLQREIVARPVEVAGHRADEVAAVLGAGMVAELDARDLRDRVGLVGDLERTGQQRLLADRLRGQLRVDAARAEEEQLADAGAAGTVDDVGRHRQVVVEEIVRLGGVGLDAADAGGGHDDVGWLFGGEERARRGAVAEIEFGGRARDHGRVARGAERADDGGADHPAVAGDVDLRGAIHQRLAWATIFRSWSTIFCTSCSKEVCCGFQPSSRTALAGLPSSCSTSVGRK